MSVETTIRIFVPCIQNERDTFVGSLIQGKNGYTFTKTENMGIAVLVNKFKDLPDLEKKCFYSGTAEIRIVNTVSNTKMGIVDFLHQPQKIHIPKIIYFSDRKNLVGRPAILFIHKNQKCFRFYGESIPNVCTVVNAKYHNTGPLHYTNYEIATDGQSTTILRPDSNGCFLAKHQNLQEMAAGLDYQGLDLQEFKLFLQEHMHRDYLAYLEHQKTQKTLDSIKNTKGNKTTPLTLGLILPKNLLGKK